MQKFQPCTPEYIISVCKGRCCQGTGNIKVVVSNSEIDKFAAKGASIKNNFIQPDERGLCPFKNDNGLCNTHGEKPMGCRISPFILTSKDTLIVRNRYRLLKCYNTKDAIPVYLAHKQSLIWLLGDEYNQLLRMLENKDNMFKGDFYLNIDIEKYLALKENSSHRARQKNEQQKHLNTT